MISASLIAIGYFYFGPIICREWFWPQMLAIIDKYSIEPWKFVVLMSTLWHGFWVLVSNLGMWAIYHAEIPFFERYKISSSPWPWNENKKEWRSLLIKSLALCFFNSIVCVPLLATMSIVTSNWEP